MSDNHLEQLIAAWLDGRLDADESKALQQELIESEAARAKFRKYTHLDVALHELADTSNMQRPAELIANVAQQTPSHPHNTSTTGQVGGKGKQPYSTLPPARQSDKRPSAFSRLTSWYTAVAVGMLIAASVFGFWSSKSGDRRSGPIAQSSSADGSIAIEAEGSSSLRKPPAPVATLASAEHAFWEKSQLKIGQALHEGDSISLREGKARISVGFGAEIVTAAPCSLTFLASDRVQLHQGNVAVDVAPWAKGFTVVTEEMDIVDLGTTFTVSATPGMKSETTVLKGVVRVHPSKVQKEQRRGLLVTEGQQVSVDEKGYLKNVAELETLPLLDSFDFGMTGPYRPVKLNNTGLGLTVGDEDLHWRVVTGPEGSFSGSQYATVCVPHERYLPNYPDTSQWISIADWETAKANSIYTFRTEFDLEGYDLNTMQLFGRFLADNGIAAVRVNGEPVQVQSWVDNVELQPFGDPQFRFVNVTEGLVKGRNVIEVDVRNGMQRKWYKESRETILSAIPNPMALRVEWYAFGRQDGLAQVNGAAKLYRQLREANSPLLTLSRILPER